MVFTHYSKTTDFSCFCIIFTVFLDDNPNSLPSLGESSGYESLKIKSEDFEEKLFVPAWQISNNTFKESKSYRSNSPLTNEPVELAASGSAGPFLTIVLERLKNFLSNSFYVNLHLTGLISRLAVYPQPLLRTYLLDHSLVLQPNVPSLFQVIHLILRTHYTECLTFTLH